MKKRMLSTILALVLLIGILPTGVLAADSTQVLALGDSITAGYGLEEPADFFTAKLGEDYTVINKAVNGYTTADILAQIRSGEINAEIASADVITITIGGNDLMALLYAKMAEMYNAGKAEAQQITAGDVVTILGGLNQSNLFSNLSLLTCAQNLLDETKDTYLMKQAAFTTALAAYQQGLNGIVASLKQHNPDVKIIVATQYNPYFKFKGATLMNGMVSLNPIYAGIEDGVTQLNAAITAGAAGRYSVAAVKTAFDAASAAGRNLYNASPVLSTISLDFHPNANGHTVLAEVFAEAIAAAMGSDDEPITSIFTDVPENEYYTEAVAWAVRNGITNGTSDTTFSPNNNCTRGQIVTFLWRAAGSPAPSSTACRFSDVDMDSYYGKAVLWAVEKGITNGTSDTEFSPEASCTRAQMATFLYRMAEGKLVSGTTSFTDVADGMYYTDAVLWSVENGITNGTGNNKFSPDMICSRAQMVTFLYRCFGK